MLLILWTVCAGLRALPPLLPRLIRPSFPCKDVLRACVAQAERGLHPGSLIVRYGDAEVNNTDTPESLALPAGAGERAKHTNSVPPTPLRVCACV